MELKQSPYYYHPIQLKPTEQPSLETHLSLHILIKDLGLSCSKAAKVLNVPYTIAIASRRQIKEDGNGAERNNLIIRTYLNSVHMSGLRQEVIRKLMRAIQQGVLTKRQGEKIYARNYDQLIISPILTEFSGQGITPMVDTIK